MRKITDVPHSGPLARINVIDFGWYYAGSMAGMLLADQGANVIRIVRPGEKELPQQQYRLLNRNKKLLELDLKTPEGRKQALSLIERADVVIENFRPGVMKRLGLDYANVKEKNPGLVYLSLPGFASTDKERASIQAWDGVIAAAAGMYDANLVRKQLNFPPVYTWVPLTSTFGAMHGAIAIMAALNAREAHGFGTVIEVPLVVAGLSLWGDHFIFEQGMIGPLRAEREQEPKPPLPDAMKPLVYSPEDSQATQQQKLASARQLLGSYFYTTADDKKLMLSIYKPGYVENFYKALGLYQQLRREGFTNDGPWDTLGLGTNLSTLHGLGLSPERKARLRELTQQALNTKTAAEWEPILEKAGVPFAVFRTRDEWLALKPLLKSGLFTQMDNGHSALTVPGRMVDMSGPDNVLPGERFNEPEPVSLSQVDRLLTQSPARHSQGECPPLKKGDLLKGLKVLDLCNIIAGPESSYTLAQYGADVIKAEPPKSNDYPNNIRVGLEVYQGKRSILLDVTTAPGREIFNQLVRWADVVIHNVLDDTARRLGVTHTQLQAINPNVVSCQLSCFGGSYRGVGGWETRRGHDGEAQAPTGVMVHYGSLEEPVFHGGLSNDVMTGLATAFSCLLGLYQKHKTGYAGEGRSSLARSACFNQLPCMIAKNGNSYWGEPRGQFAVGPSECQRLYRCRDGWIFAGAAEARVVDFVKAVTGREERDIHRLEAAFAEQDCAYWQAKLNAIDIGSHRVVNVDDICAEGVRRVGNEPADETATPGAEVLRWDDHPSGKPIICLAPNWVRVGEEQFYRRLSPAPRRGAHTRDILRELGYSPDETEELIRLNIAHEFLPVLGDKYFFELER